MSAHLEKHAATEAGFLFNAHRQLFQSVPLIPQNINLTGKTALVTGANVGLGLACARHFLQLGASRLIMAVRSPDKGDAAAVGLRTVFPSAKIDVWELEMASPRSVQAFAARCADELDRLHVAVLNAGLGKYIFERTEESGCRETTLQVNYLSTALLAILLLPLMKPSPKAPQEPGRLTIITSDAALGVDLPDVEEGDSLLDALDQADKFDGFQQYSRSKLLITMFAGRLAAEVVRPEDVIINSCNPGAVKGTAFLNGLDSWILKALFHTIFAVFGRNPEDGARTYVHASVVLGKESHGSFTDWKIRSWPVAMYGESGRLTSDKLWDETMAELRFANVAGVLNGLHGGKK